MEFRGQGCLKCPPPFLSSLSLPETRQNTAWLVPRKVAGRHHSSLNQGLTIIWCLQVFPGNYIKAGRQGSRRMGDIEPPRLLPVNADTLSSASYRYSHTSVLGPFLYGCAACGSAHTSTAACFTSGQLRSKPNPWPLSILPCVRNHVGRP